MQPQDISHALEALTGPLAQLRRQEGWLPVVGEGRLDARILFIGEAPGRKEAETGKPFCGASGRVLDRLLADAGLDRSQVYITNVVKDRPPKNRDPKPEEIAEYGPLLDAQIAVMAPAVIAPLGRFAMTYVLERYASVPIGSISEMHGSVQEGSVDGTPVHIVPLYHPAVAVYNRTKYPLLLSDMQTVAGL